MISIFHEGQVDSAPHVAHIVLHILVQTNQ